MELTDSVRSRFTRQTKGTSVEYQVREMELSETESMIRYFVDADVDFLAGMGANWKKLPSASAWFELLKQDFARPLQQKQFYYLVWLLDGVPVGHCNINKIEFGSSASMHLHIWSGEHRRSGCATKLLQPSIVHFFERFDLQELYCEPYAKNPAPNRALPRAGFQLVKTYETTPGWISFHQTVNRSVLHRDTALRTSEDSSVTTLKV